VSAIDVAECRICRCTEDDACDGGCWWVADPVGLGDLCSGCEQLALWLEQITVVLGAATRPLCAREIATRTGIDHGALTGEGGSILEALADGGHLELIDEGELRRYTLPLEGSRAA
jgi:hypothetical protein